MQVKAEPASIILDAGLMLRHMLRVLEIPDSVGEVVREKGDNERDVQAGPLKDILISCD
jgi:hypothetical protein